MLTYADVCWRMPTYAEPRTFRHLELEGRCLGNQAVLIRLKFRDKSGPLFSLAAKRRVFVLERLNVRLDLLAALHPQIAQPSASVFVLLY